MYRKYLYLFALIICNIQIISAIDPVKQSPYFKLITENVGVESFPLLSTKVRSKLAGPIADVEVSQTYRNDGTLPIEAVYVFPGSTKAAVYGMKMIIGNRTITAEIQEKQKARELYTQAKEEGKRTSLLEQDKPNVFTMNVANIMPGEEVKLVLNYTEFIVSEDGIYSFAFPTVVGPRFTDKINTPAFVSQTSYLPERSTIPYDVDFYVQVQAPISIKSADSKTHKLNVLQNEDGYYSAKVSNPEKAGNRDFIFDYSLAGNEISTGTMLYEHGDEKFFLSIVEPPIETNLDQVTPREYMFIVDVSGSMRGFPIDVSKQLMQDLLSELRPVDYFNVLLFAGGSKTFSKMPMLANRQNIKKAINFLTREQGGGGTQLLSAVRTAMASPKAYDNSSRSLIIITDGYIHVEEACFNYIQDHLNESNFFAFGIGSSVNRFLIEGIAHVGRGESFVVTNKEGAKEKAQKLITYIQSPVMTDVNICFNDFDAYDFYPRKMPDLLAQRPLYIFGKYTDATKGSIVIGGKTSSGDFRKEIDLSTAKKGEPAIRYLWAREKLRYLSDYESVSHNEKFKDKIVEVGLKYNLMSKHTSFLAIDEQTVNDDGDLATVRQALPLPQGVSNYAVGFEMGAEGFSNNEEVIEERIVFVHVQSLLTEKANHDIREMVIQICQYTDKEAREMLDGNLLTINLNPKDGIIEITDQLQILTDDQLRVLEINMIELLTLVNAETTVNITIAWL